MDFFTSFTIIIILVLILITVIILLTTNNNHKRHIYVGGCAGTRFGCCPDGITPKYDVFGSNCVDQKIVGGCAGTRYGCCDDQQTAKANPEGTNCPGYKPENVGGCAGTRWGCCPDGKTARENPWGGNCGRVVENLWPNARIDEFAHVPIDSIQDIIDQKPSEPKAYNPAVFDDNVDF